MSCHPSPSLGRSAKMWLLVVIMGLTAVVSSSSPPFDQVSLRTTADDAVIATRPSAAAEEASATESFTQALFAGTRQRLLQESTGFEQFNELFADATLSLGDYSVPLMDNLAELDIVNLQCSQIVIGDLITGHTLIQENGVDVIEFTVTLSPFNLECTAEYRYKAVLVFSGTGSVTAVAEGNSLTTKIHIKSASTFAQAPPISSAVAFCEAVIKTDGRVSFQGDLVASIANGFKGPISDVIDQQTQGAICKEFSILGPDFFGSLLADLKLRFDGWLSPLPQELADPLFPERNFSPPNNVQLVNFRPVANGTTPESVADLFVGLLKEEDALFGESEVDPQTGETDLGFNNFIRSSLLEDNGWFVLDVVELQPGFNPVIFSGHDNLTETSMTIDNIKILGLDKLVTFDPFQEIGDYTLGNDLSWTTLAIEADLMVNIKPSSLPGSMIASPKPIRIVENITVAIDLSTLDVALSLFLAVDRTKFDALKLGSLLKADNILPCMMSSMADLEVSELNVTVGDFSVPTLTGFVSPGIDRTVTNIVKAAFDAYKPTMLRAMPGIFQTTVRAALNGRLGNTIGTNSDGDCKPLVIPPLSNGQSASVDFRDFFLDPADAKKLGGSGNQPYGTLGPLAYSLLTDRLTAAGSDGRPMINDLIIRRFTERQSGVGGSLVFPDTLFEIGDASAAEVRSSTAPQDDLFLNGTFSVLLRNFRIENIDTVGSPMELMKVTSDPYVLENAITIGGGQQVPMKLTVALVTGEDETRDEYDITLSMASLTVSADLRALLDADSFFSFPLGDLLEFNCWLASFKSVQLNEDGFAVDPKAERGLSLKSFVSAISGFSLEAACVKCNSTGATLLPELQQILQTAGAISTLGDRLPELIDSVAMGETAQTALDRLTADSARFCPTNAAYDVNAVKSDYGMISFPTLSEKSIDTILFAALIGAQTGFVVFAENQRAKGLVDTDPLSFQRSFVAPEGVSLLDWTNIGNSSGLGDIADEIFGRVRQFLGGNETSVFDAEELLGKLLDDDGAIEFNPDLSFSRGDIEFAVQSVRVVGLDSFGVLDIFEPVAPQTLVSKAEFANLDITIKLSLDSPSTPEPPQVLTVSFSVKDVAANIGLFAAFDLNTVGKLELGSLLSTKTIFRCILSAAVAFEITELDVTAGSFSTPTVTGLHSDTGSVAAAALGATFTQYQATITEAIPAIFNGVLRETLTNLLFGSDESICHSSASDDSKSFIDLRDLILPAEKSRLLGGSGLSPYGDLVSTAFTYLKDEWFVSKSGDGLAEINEQLIRSFTESQSGTPGRLFFEGDIFDPLGGSLEKAGIDATVGIRLYDFFVNNLDTIGSPAVLLEPINGKAYEVKNSVAFGIDRRLEIGVHLKVDLVGAETDISNDIVVSVELDNVRVMLIALAKMSEHAFMSFPLEDITKLQCWLATIPAPKLDERGVIAPGQEPSLAVQEFIAALSEVDLNITCKNCTGPKFVELSDRLSSSESSDDLTRSANSILDLVSKVVSGKFLQVVAARALNDAPYLCPHNAKYKPGYERLEFGPFEVDQGSPSGVAFFLAVVVVGCVLLIMAGLILLALKVFVLNRHRKWAAALRPDQIKRLREDQMQNDLTETKLNNMTNSMSRSSNDIPLLWRASMPFIIVANIGFFISGHASLGGSISILVSLGGQTFREDSFFAFSMATSTLDLWKAGARELAILIFIFSFLWPYTKQLLTFWLWFASPSAVSVSRRGSVLLWLDFFAKWSIIDVFVLIITIVTFRVSIQSPKLSFMPDDFYSIDLLVIPKWGLYANMTAQIISQLSSHVIIHYHRRIVDNAMLSLKARQPIQHTSTADDTSDETPHEQGRRAQLESEHPEVLCRHAFYRPHRGEADRLVVKPFVNPVMIAFSICTCGLVIAGCFVPSYSLDILGLVGILVESGQDFQAANTKFSVLSTLGVLFGQAGLTGGAADYIGLGSLSILLILSVLLVPALQLGALMIQWFMPLRPNLRRQLSVVLEILQAWQYAEVYLLSLLVGAWQLGPVSEFMINPYCEPLQRIFAELSYYGIVKEEDAQCLRTNVNVESTFYVLFIGTVLLAILNTIVMTAVAQYFRDQDATRIDEGTTVSDLTDNETGKDYHSSNGDAAESIRPVPVQFSDRFRWLLFREDTMLGRETSNGDGSRSNQRPVYEETQERPVVERVKEHPEDEYDMTTQDTGAILRVWSSDSQEESLPHV